MEIPVLVIVPPVPKYKTPRKLRQKRDLNAPPTKRALKRRTTIVRKKAKQAALDVKKAALDVKKTTFNAEKATPEAENAAEAVAVPTTNPNTAQETAIKLNDTP